MVLGNGKKDSELQKGLVGAPHLYLSLAVKLLEVIFGPTDASKSVNKNSTE